MSSASCPVLKDIIIRKFDLYPKTKHFFLVFFPLLVEGHPYWWVRTSLGHILLGTNKAKVETFVHFFPKKGCCSPLFFVATPFFSQAFFPLFFLCFLSLDVGSCPFPRLSLFRRPQSPPQRRPHRVTLKAPRWCVPVTQSSHCRASHGYSARGPNKALGGKAFCSMTRHPHGFHSVTICWEDSQRVAEPKGFSQKCGFFSPHSWKCGVSVHPGLGAEEQQTTTSSSTSENVWDFAAHRVGA